MKNGGSRSRASFRGFSTAPIAAQGLTATARPTRNQKSSGIIAELANQRAGFSARRAALVR